jgi:hypothetical protein
MIRTNIEGIALLEKLLTFCPLLASKSEKNSFLK